MLWLSDNGSDDFWLAQRPQENALNSPPSVETLQTLLGENLPAEIQKFVEGAAHHDRSPRVTEPIRIFISGSCAGLAEVRQALSVALGDQGRRDGGRRPLERR